MDSLLIEAVLYKLIEGYEATNDHGILKTLPHFAMMSTHAYNITRSVVFKKQKIDVMQGMFHLSKRCTLFDMNEPVKKFYMFPNFKLPGNIMHLQLTANSLSVSVNNSYAFMAYEPGVLIIVDGNHNATKLQLDEQNELIIGEDAAAFECFDLIFQNEWHVLIHSFQYGFHPPRGQDIPKDLKQVLDEQASWCNNKFIQVKL